MGCHELFKALELNPIVRNGLYWLRYSALQRNNNYNIAVPQFQKAVSLAPNDIWGLGLA